jgi:hypothetical protein
MLSSAGDALEVIRSCAVPKPGMRRGSRKLGGLLPASRHPGRNRSRSDRADERRHVRSRSQSADCQPGPSTDGVQNCANACSKRSPSDVRLWFFNRRTATITAAMVAVVIWTAIISSG